MRISDWSSDVCSSDLGVQQRQPGLYGGNRAGIRDYPRDPCPRTEHRAAPEHCRSARQQGEDRLDRLPAAEAEIPRPESLRGLPAGKGGRAHRLEAVLPVLGTARQVSCQDRKSVVEGKNVSVRVELGG